MSRRVWYFSFLLGCEMLTGIMIPSSFSGIVGSATSSVILNVMCGGSVFQDLIRIGVLGSIYFRLLLEAEPVVAFWVGAFYSATFP